METIKHDIRFTHGDSYVLNMTLKNLTEDVRLTYFTVKDSTSGSTVIRKSLGDGIKLKESRPYKQEITYRLILSSADTMKLEEGFSYLYDFQFVLANVVMTPIFGLFTLTPSVSGAMNIVTESAVVVSEEFSTDFATTAPAVGVETEIDPIATRRIGNMSLLSTMDKTTLVGAINEVNSEKQNVTDNKLQTGAKDVVGAINEVNSKYTQFEEDLRVLDARTLSIRGDVDQQDQVIESQGFMIIANDEALKKQGTDIESLKTFLGIVQ